MDCDSPPPSFRKWSVDYAQSVGDIALQNGTVIGTWFDVQVDKDNSDVPCQRSLHVGAVYGDSMFIFGGYDGLNRVNDFYQFCFTTRQWTKVPPNGTPPSPRDRHTGVVHGDFFYVFAGFDGSSRVNDFYAYSFVKNIWSQLVNVNGTVPTARHSHASVVYGNSMYCWGGYDGGYRNDFHEFNFDTQTWREVPSQGKPPRPRYRSSCCTKGSKLYLFGGHDGSRHLNDVNVFDFNTSSWSQVQAEGPAPLPRDSHAAVVHGSSMYIFGGSTGGAVGDFYRLQLDKPKWHPVEAKGQVPAQRFCHVCCVYRDSMYCFGGYDGSNRLNDFQEFYFGPDMIGHKVEESTLLDELRASVNDELTSDITFIVEGEPVYAHKVLCTRCPYFRAMLTGEMMESRAHEIVIQDVRRTIFLALLEYLYTDSIDIQMDSAMEVFEAADKFGISRLKHIVENCMLASICVENVAAIFHAADLYQATTLRQMCFKYILCNFDEVSKTPAFEEMGRTNVELVFEILRSR